MSAIDKCEQVIIEALAKLGWQIVKRQYPIFYSQIRHALFADLRLKHPAQNDRLMIVEVKCFANPKLYTDDLQHALGQYLLYRMALRYLGIQDQIFLAVPQHIYEILFTEPVISATLRETKVNYLVVDLEMQEVNLWQTW